MKKLVLVFIFTLFIQNQLFAKNKEILLNKCISELQEAPFCLSEKLSNNSCAQYSFVPKGPSHGFKKCIFSMKKIAKVDAIKAMSLCVGASIYNGSDHPSCLENGDANVSLNEAINKVDPSRAQSTSITKLNIEFDNGSSYSYSKRVQDKKSYISETFIEKSPYLNEEYIDDSEVAENK